MKKTPKEILNEMSEEGIRRQIDFLRNNQEGVGGAINARDEKRFKLPFTIEQLQEELEDRGLERQKTP